ncbi:hypothetical protein KFZ58_12655 [Virgibacillus sp. NKC19-16]|uniref:hypothetical protein n=1 Tax=Virgibacillus salidurans TaxID=2831673 RepID=UPI001F1C8ED3|nr:hypothetical protein [Virgibacillus sp. NKC19-16]UJL45258.1 hypothetical protein KFZ58_12655 [Virgibacillus sp. NKC19-16]
MSVDIFIIMWGVATFMVVRAYLKMGKEDRMSAMKDFMSSNFIFTIGFLAIGAFLATFGNTFSLNTIFFNWKKEDAKQ